MPMAWMWMTLTALVLVAVGVTLTFPFVTAQLSCLWNLCILCFKPPFIYLLLNAIIISILASSKYFNSPPQPQPQQQQISTPQFLSPTHQPLLPSLPKPTPQGGKALRVVGKPKRHDTLDNTWKAITERRSTYVNAPDTWHNSRSAPEEHRTTQPVSVRLRKEPSLSQDELNRRVEEFIRKFNHQMRLQRQESLKHHMNL